MFQCMIGSNCPRRNRKDLRYRDKYNCCYRSPPNGTMNNLCLYMRRELYSLSGSGNRRLSGSPPKLEMGIAADSGEYHRRRRFERDRRCPQGRQ
jgi:hypothetical protein